eukprot:903667-Pyramimonas_sp.AAC.1
MCRMKRERLGGLAHLPGIDLLSEDCIHLRAERVLTDSRPKRMTQQQEIGEENMFIFGAREGEVKKLRAERRTATVDPRFTAAVNLVRNGGFGWADYFAPIVASVDVSTARPYHSSDRPPLRI